MNHKIKILLCATFVLTLVFTPAADARSLGKALGHSLIKKIMRRDRIRDTKTLAKPLSKSRTVFRYTSRAQAKREAKHGLAPKTHMTATGGSGRPLSAKAAQQRYGLPARPEVRETLHLKAHHYVKKNKALGGKPGYGELTSPNRIPPGAVRRIVPLHNKP